MYAEVVGSGDAPDVVLLHGGIGTGSFHWSKQAKALAERYRVHMPDLPGHGRTPVADGAPYSRKLHVDAVVDYLEQLGSPVHLAGFSMGGHAALALACERPELLSSLTVVGVAIRDHEGLHEWRERFQPDRFQAENPLWVRQLSKLHSPLGGQDAWRDVLVRDSAGELDVEVDLDALALLEAPVLLVRGDRDQVVGPGHYAELRSVWPQADELVVPAGGHDVHITRAEIVRPALLDFLERVNQ